MPDSGQAAVATPERKTTSRASQPTRRRQPPYYVILHDDDDHTYVYVIELLRKLFGHNPTAAYLMAKEVDATGRVIVDTTTKERAELKRDQIHAYGADPKLARCKGSMRATIEPTTDE